MHMRQELIRSLLASREDGDLVSVSHCGEPGVAHPAIRSHLTAGLHRILHKGAQAGRGGVTNPSQANPADPPSDLLRRDRDQSLLPLAWPTALALLETTQVGFVHLHETAEPFATGADHRSTELVQPRPRRLVTAQAQDTLDTQGTGPILLARYGPHRSKPQRQRKVAALKYGPRRHRDLAPTLAAQPKPPTHRPRLSTSTAGADKAIGPTKLTQVRPTGLVGGKAGFELGQGSRVVLHDTLH